MLVIKLIINFFADKEGVACVRFQDEKCKEKAGRLFEKNEFYPFHIYDEEKRNWLGDAPPNTAPLQALPLTTQYDQGDTSPGKVLVMRTAMPLREANFALFRQYDDLGVERRTGRVKIGMFLSSYMHPVL